MKLNILIYLLLICVGCNQFSGFEEKKLYGTWQLSDVSVTDNDEHSTDDKLLKAAQNIEMVQQGMIYSFFPDNTFTKMTGNGEYEHGQWKASENGKELFFSGMPNETVVLLKIETQKEKQVLFLSNKKLNTTMTFVKNFEALEEYTQDPFYHTNNTWRIKANQSETPELLHERLGNYIKHLAYLLSSATTRNQAAISFAFSQGIVKIYNGGIGIKPSIPDTWSNTYFNAEEAVIAYQMFEQYLATTPYRGAGVGDWYKDDCAILTSIYGDIKAGKFPK